MQNCRDHKRQHNHYPPSWALSGLNPSCSALSCSLCQFQKSKHKATESVCVCVRAWEWVSEWVSERVREWVSRLVRHVYTSVRVCVRSERERQESWKKEVVTDRKFDNDKLRKRQKEKGKHLKVRQNRQRSWGTIKGDRRLWDSAASSLQRRSSVRMPSIPQIRPRVVCFA